MNRRKNIRIFRTLTFGNPLHGNPMKYLLMFALALGIFAAAASAGQGDLILNEYNAVGAGDYLAGGNYRDDPTKVDTYWGTIPGMPDGRIEGNGGNWIELVVIKDHLDIRGWQLRWAETGVSDTDGTDPWYGNPEIEQGIITFSPTAPIWSNLRKGTIITIIERDFIYVDTDWDGDDRNFTDGLGPGDPRVDVTIDLRTDTSYNPIPSDPNHPNADWWIHISSRYEQGQPDPLVTTITNVVGDGPGDFSVGPDDWEMTIVDDQATWVFGPIGENITTFGNFPGGINDEEAGRLEDDPAYDVDNDDYDDVTSTTFSQPNEWGGVWQNFYDLRYGLFSADIDGDGRVDLKDFTLMANYWLVFGCGYCFGADLSGDGNVTFDDVTLLAAYWLEGTF